MKLSDFTFDLPKDLIAEYPSENRDESRLMVVHRDTGKIEHKVFKDILGYFDDGDALIVNNARVFPARLFGRIDNTTSRGRTIRFLFDGTDEEFRAVLDKLGHTPLPKYIKRPAEESDKERYQTVYATEEGAVAAPTAGLHFSRELMKRLEIKGANFAEITLHVGLGTFRSIDVEDLSKHKMDAEYYSIPDQTAEIVNKAKAQNKRICAVGTTSMRTIESSVSAGETLKPGTGWTNLFIHPPYHFSIANCMITNFHLPKTSLIIMISAFGGQELIQKAYKEAIKEKYRFYSYGDAMLIL